MTNELFDQKQYFSSCFHLSKTQFFDDWFICQQNIVLLWSLANSVLILGCIYS